MQTLQMHVADTLTGMLLLIHGQQSRSCVSLPDGTAAQLTLIPQALSQATSHQHKCRLCCC